MARNFNVNTDAVIAFTNKLEKMHRSAFPVAVRGTLNKAAFDVRQVTMPESTKKAFTIRERNFFRANSRVEMAKGFSVKNMRAIVGFRPARANNFAVKDLEKQEHGGTIKKRALIPTDKSRGGSKTRTVRTPNRLEKITNVVNPANIRGKNKKQQFVKAAILAGKGGYVLGNMRKKAMLLRVVSIKRIGRNTAIKSDPLYSYKKGRDVSIPATRFMERASLKTAKKMTGFYINEAKRQFKRLAR